MYNAGGSSSRVSIRTLDLVVVRIQTRRRSHSIRKRLSAAIRATRSSGPHTPAVPTSGTDRDPDQDTFLRARAASQMTSNIPFIKIELKDAKIWKFEASQEEQERLYIAASSQRDAINADLNPAGSYTLGANNCGTWAQSMIVSQDLEWPFGTSVCNFGVGIGGPGDIGARSLTIGAAAAGEVKRAMLKLQQKTVPTRKNWVDIYNQTMSKTSDAVIAKSFGRRPPLLILFFIAVACQQSAHSTSAEPISLKARLHRSGAGVWETRRSPTSGIEVAVPRDLCGFVDEPTLGVTISLHTVHRQRGVLDDKKCLMQIEIERMNQQRFDKERGPAALSIEDDHPKAKYWRWDLQRHHMISRFDEREFTYYRYDVECSDGDLLTARATVANVYEGNVSLYDKEDDAFVRRILRSLRCTNANSHALPTGRAGAGRDLGSRRTADRNLGPPGLAARRTSNGARVRRERAGMTRRRERSSALIRWATAYAASTTPERAWSRCGQARRTTPSVRGLSITSFSRGASTG